MKRTVVVRDERGRPMSTVSGLAVTITVAGWDQPPAQLPMMTAGFTVVASRAAVAPSLELERLIDHVHGWSGWDYDGAPLKCTRDMLRSVLLSCPHVITQLQRAITDATSPGMEH